MIGDYLAYTSYSYYPLSIYLMHDSTSIIIDKASNNKDIFVNVYNHYSYVKVQLSINDSLFRIVLVGTIGVVGLIVGVIILVWCFVKKKGHRHRKTFGRAVDVGGLGA